MSSPSRSPLAGIRDVLVGTTVEGEFDPPIAAIGYGLTLAKAANAHLTVQSASWRLTGDDAWLGEFDYVGEALVDRRLDALARSIAERAAGDAAQVGVVCTTEAPGLTYPDVVTRLATQARLHDLTVLDAGPRRFDLDRETIERALFESGRPVIAVPPGRDAFAARRIIVAWDGSAQAARAANDALPFLRAAEAVEIVSVVGEKDLSAAVAGAEFAPHLARHGVTVSVNVLPVVDDVAETLRTQAGLFRADMLVMGAYRHARLKEWFFGGVTQSLLARSPLPLFLAH